VHLEIKNKDQEELKKEIKNGVFCRYSFLDEAEKEVKKIYNDIKPVLDQFKKSKTKVVLIDYDADKNISEARTLFDNGKVELSGIDKILFESTDLGKFELFEGEMVPLDLPLEVIEEINEAEYHGKKVPIGKPMRSSGPKKYKVYVKNPKTGNVKVVNFGDVKGGLSAKVSDPKARRSFAARHQ
jgi:hypothetical protein